MGFPEFLSRYKEKIENFRNKEGVGLGPEQGKNPEEMYETFSEDQREALRVSQQKLEDAAPDPDVFEGYSCPAADCNGRVEAVNLGISKESGQTKNETYGAGEVVYTEDSTSQSDAVGMDIPRKVLTCRNDNCNLHHNDNELSAIRNLHTQSKEKSPRERMKEEGFIPDSQPEEALDPDRPSKSFEQKEEQKNKSEQQQTRNKRREEHTETEDRRQTRR